jgi:hypothetical protein
MSVVFLRPPTRTKIALQAEHNAVYLIFQWTELPATSRTDNNAHLLQTVITIGQNNVPVTFRICLVFYWKDRPKNTNHVICIYPLQKQRFCYQVNYVMVNLFEENVAFSTLSSAVFFLFYQN